MRNKNVDLFTKEVFRHASPFVASPALIAGKEETAPRAVVKNPPILFLEISLWFIRYSRLTYLRTILLAPCLLKVLGRWYAQVPLRSIMLRR